MNACRLLLTILLAAAQDDKKADPPKCECGATWKIDGDALSLMWKDKTICTTPVTAARASVLGKDVDLSRGGTIACPCGKTVKYGAQMALKHWTGTTACDGACKASWTVTETDVSFDGADLAAAFSTKSYKIKNHKVNITGEIDLLKDRSFNCL